jgi:ribose 5-phosphate isomerase A
MSASAKEAAGRRAAELVEGGTIVGLGTGSTVWFALLRLAERIREEGLAIEGVPTSRDTEQKALELGIPLVGLEAVESIALTVDGADEIDPRFDMIKGGGGALLREKVVASLTEREVIVVGEDKLVERLGKAFPLPVEVVPFALPAVARALERLGCEPSERKARGGGPFVTDNGNRILDCRFPGGIEDPQRLEAELGRIPGVVESGLFLGLAHALVIGRADGTTELRERPRR